MKRFYVTKKQCRDYIHNNLNIFPTVELFELQLKANVFELNSYEGTDNAQRKFFNRVLEIFEKEFQII